MRLEGWNHIPRGYGADFDLRGAPWWLRLWFHTPFIDRYAHPTAVARGHGYLIPHPEWPPEAMEVPGPGWRIRPADYEPPGSMSWLRLEG
jgi:hypothetical protein